MTSKYSLHIGLFISFGLIFLLLTHCSAGKTEEINAKKATFDAREHDLDYVNLDVEGWEEYTKDINTTEEIIGQISYFDSNGNEQFSSKVGLKLSGIFIKKVPQKSISVEFSSKKFGSDKVSFQMFPHRRAHKLEGFVLRAHGNPMYNTYYNDGLANQILDEYTDLEFSSYKPVVLYLNGKYHGLYNIREKKNRDFLKVLYKLEKDSIELLQLEGGLNTKPNADWERLYNYAKSEDLSEPIHYQYIKDRMDIDNFIDYIIAETYLANFDWPKTNVKVWRVKGGKWRWMFFDCDRGFIKTDFNMVEHITGVNQWDPERVNTRLINSTVMIRGLMTNMEFRRDFLVRYQDLMNTTFTTENAMAMSAEMKAVIESEVPHQIARWKDDTNEHSFNVIEDLATWEKNLGFFHTFLTKRPAVVRDQLREAYELGEDVSLTVATEDLNKGKIQINRLTYNGSSLTGKYFSNLPIQLTAVANEGYAFDHWEGINSTGNSVQIDPSKYANVTIKAVFKKSK